MDKILNINTTTSPFVMVIFGATGDLAKMKLIPALFSLYKQQQLPQDFYIFGFARREMSDAEFVGTFEKDQNDPMWKDFTTHLHYQQGKFESELGYFELIGRLKTIDEKMGACITRLFYLATPPDHYREILDKLHSTELSEGCGPTSASSFAEVSQDMEASAGKPTFVKATDDKQGIRWTRIIIEKPFGRDIHTARELDRRLSEIFEERQIFRVDHYLAKDVVQNLIAFRFANSIFEPVWNNKFIDHVQVTFAEKSGIGERGKFFDGIGMLRDVAQNHLLQLVATVTMEQPRSFSKEDVRDARAAAIKSIKCIEPNEVAESVVSGQYERYLAEDDVAPNSSTETFVAMKFFVDTPRFSGVPFYVRAGKNMPSDVVEISIVFVQTCHILFKEYGCPEIGNVLTIRIQPNEGIRMRVIAKHPGAKVALDTVDMKFSYHAEFGGHGADAYEKVLMDIFSGDQMLFNRSDELESSWDFITKILEGWKLSDNKPLKYASGTNGPEAADLLIEKDGKKWL